MKRGVDYGYILLCDQLCKRGDVKTRLRAWMLAYCLNPAEIRGP